MANKIQIRRGLETNLPTLDVGEVAFTTDSHKFFIGTSGSNIEFRQASDFVEIAGDTMTGALTIDVNSATALVVEQNGVHDNVLVVDTANGRVGIGTASPEVAFHVVSGLDTDNSFVDGVTNFAVVGPDTRIRGVASDLGSWGGAFTLDQVDTSNPTDFENTWGIIRQTNNDGPGDGTLNITYGTNADPAANSRLFVIQTNGNVGIGATSPSAKLDIDSDVIRLRNSKTPASAGASGNTGDIAWDSDYIYVCVATNTWKRATLNSW